MTVQIEDIAAKVDIDGDPTLKLATVRKVLNVLAELGIATLDATRLAKASADEGEIKGRAAERAAVVAHIGGETFRRIAVDRARGGQQLAPLEEVRMQILEGRHDGGRRFGG